VHYSDHLIREIVDAGVSGYMLKSDPEYDLLVAVETLARGRIIPHPTPLISSIQHTLNRERGSKMLVLGEGSPRLLQLKLLWSNWLQCLCAWCRARG
jgi:hypothetical protein